MFFQAIRSFLPLCRPRTIKINPPRARRFNEIITRVNVAFKLDEGREARTPINERKNRWGRVIRGNFDPRFRVPAKRGGKRENY